MLRCVVTTGTVLLLALGAPSVAEACLCVSGVWRADEPPPPPRREFHERDRIFIGHALEVDELPQQNPKQIVRFVVEASWRGAMPDTVTLRVGAHAPCASYIAGIRYFVFADVDSVSGALVTQPCDYAWGIDYGAAVRMQNELGPPGWTAPPMGRRLLDRHAVRLGEPLLRDGADTLTFSVPRKEEVARFQVGSFDSDSVRWRRPILLSPGLYQFRITWPDGSSYESYLSMRCERPMPGYHCSVLRVLSLLRPR